jgi:hypothetical protein
MLRNRVDTGRSFSGLRIFNKPRPYKDAIQQTPSVCYFLP